MISKLRLLFIILLGISSQLCSGQNTPNEIKKIVTNDNIYRGKILKVGQDSIHIELINSKAISLSKSSVLLVTDIEKPKYSKIKVEFHDGRTLNGEVSEITKETLHLRLPSGDVVEINKTDIKTVGNNLNSNRNNYFSQPFYLPSALASQKGNHFFRTYMGLLYDFNFGVTDRLDLSMGTEIISIISNNGDVTPVFQFGAKYQLTNFDSNINFGLATRYAIGNDGGIFMVFLPITLGDKKANFSFIPTFLDNSDSDEIFTLAISFNVPLSKKAYFSSDMLYADDAIGGSSTVNFVTKKGLSFGLGLFFLTDGGGVAPNASLTVPLSGPWENH